MVVAMVAAMVVARDASFSFSFLGCHCLRLGGILLGLSSFGEDRGFRASEFLWVR